MDNAYHSAMRKLKRSSSLIAELASIINRYDGACIAPRQLPDECVGWNIKLREPPEDVAPILGDIVHNLRAALDHTAVATVKLNGGKTKSVYFPFSEDVDGLEVMIKRRNFDRASEDAKQLLRRIRPYKGGNIALRGLHDLDVVDKHDRLIPVLTIGMQRDQKFSIGQATFEGCQFVLTDGYGIISVPGNNVSALRSIPLKLFASFAEDQPFAGSEVIPVLKGLHNLVGSIINAFASLYRG